MTAAALALVLAAAQIARATDVMVDALGFSMPLAPADLAARGVFIHAVEDGVVVRP